MMIAMPITAATYEHAGHSTHNNNSTSLIKIGSWFNTTDETITNRNINQLLAFRLYFQTHIYSWRVHQACIHAWDAQFCTACAPGLYEEHRCYSDHIMRQACMLPQITLQFTDSESACMDERPHVYDYSNTVPKMCDSKFGNIVVHHIIKFSRES